MSAVTICSDFGAQKIKLATVSTVSPYISHEVMGLEVMVLVLGNLYSVYHNSPLEFTVNLKKFSMLSVQFSCSVVSDSVIPCTTACQASLTIANSRSLLKLMSIE